MTVSAILITRDDQANIDSCLDSLKWVDEIVCIDQMSRDRTQEKLTERGIKFQSSEEQDRVKIRNQALAACKSDWVIHVEPNERVPSALARELTRRISKTKEKGAYAVKMDTTFFERKLRFCGTQDDFRIKVWPTGSAKFVPEEKEAVTSLPVKTLNQPMIIYDIQNRRHYEQYINKNLGVDVAILRRSRQEVRFLEYTLYPILIFLKNYFLRLGFLDGLNGFLYAYYKADYTFLRFYRFKKLLDEEMLGGRIKL